MYHNKQSSPTVLVYLAKKNYHYKQKCNSLRYKHSDTHNNTSLLHRMSTKTSWFFPLHHFTHTVCLRAHLLSGFSWLVSTWGKTGSFAVQNWLVIVGIQIEQGWLHVWINRLKFLSYSSVITTMKMLRRSVKNEHVEEEDNKEANEET